MDARSAAERGGCGACDRFGNQFFRYGQLLFGGNGGRISRPGTEKADVARESGSASKVYFNDGHLSRAAIEREIEGSLRRLGTDYLDLYIIHRYDATTPPEETMRALDDLVKAGKVRALGASAMYGFQFHNLQLLAKENGLTPFVSMQNHYNPLYREDERELIPICRQMNVALTPYSPLAAGRVARADWSGDTVRSRTDKVAHAKYDTTEAADRQIAQRIAALAQKYGTTMTAVSLAWHFAKGVASPVIGATKTAHLDEAVGAFAVSLTAEDVALIDEFYLPHKVMGALAP